ncbi:MAG: hypothetical protein KIT14_20970 [bacterium]|nr:hypothetical protein [bacterium]
MFVRALLVVLASAGLAAAQSQTFGSSLATAPNVSIDCALYPTIADPSGAYALVSSGVADCTWRQAGVFGVANDPRFSSVPGDGRITSVTIRSGPAPVAPIRFAIFRQLSTPGFGAESQCCFFVGETAPVQPTPNSVETFAVDLPVQRNTIDGIFAVDLVGISAAAGTGTLPLFVPGRVNAFDLTTPGSVNAGIFYPRLGAIPNDVGGGRREEGIPGVELLMQWTWCPAGFGGGPGACTAGGGGGGGGGGAAGPALRATNAPVSGPRALVDLVCNGDAACRGRLELLGLAAIASAPARAGGTPRYGKVKYDLAPGATATLRVKLKRKAKRLVKKNGSLQVGVRLTPAGGTPITGTLVLTR